MKKTKHTQIHEIGPNAREVLKWFIAAAAPVLLAAIWAYATTNGFPVAAPNSCGVSDGPPDGRPAAFASVVVVGFEQHQLAGHADPRPQVDADDLALGGVLDPR